MSKVKTILLVCTGNSCRSVMAAGLLQKMLKGKSDYKIITAGTAPLKGLKATKEATQIMSEEGIDVSGHISQSLTNEMIREADLILVMERRHKEQILMRALDQRDKVHLLNEFGRIEKEKKLVNPDVPDPIGRPLDYYRKIFAIIKESLARIAKELLKEQ